MKPTLWTELKKEDFEILERATNGTLLIHSDKLPRKKRWFIESLKGNFYSRYTGKGGDFHAEAYIIKKEAL